jgi:2-amino-4-hydroxy-6-hydroxymethyldihydropteridine diphosphokinase
VQKTKVQTVVLMGSNAPDAQNWLQRALNQLPAVGEVLSVSGVYASPSWGFDGPDFRYAAVLLQTDQSPHQVLHGLLAIEAQLGRVRTTNGPRYTSRTIDLDLLIWADAVIDAPDLQIPHPRLADRRFALLPLQELVPNWLTPAGGESIGTLLECCVDNNSVTLTPEKLTQFP